MHHPKITRNNTRKNILHCHSMMYWKTNPSWQQGKHQDILMLFWVIVKYVLLCALFCAISFEFFINLKIFGLWPNAMFQLLLCRPLFAIAPYTTLGIILAEQFALKKNIYFVMKKKKYNNRETASNKWSENWNWNVKSKINKTTTKKYFCC